MRVLQALDAGGRRGGKEGQAWNEKKLIHTEESLTQQLQEIQHLMTTVWFREGEASMKRDDGPPIELAREQETATIGKHRKCPGGEDQARWVRNMLQLEEGRMWEEAFAETEFYWTGHRPAEWGKGEDDSEDEQPKLTWRTGKDWKKRETLGKTLYKRIGRCWRR